MRSSKKEGLGGNQGPVVEVAEREDASTSLAVSTQPTQDRSLMTAPERKARSFEMTIPDEDQWSRMLAFGQDLISTGMLPEKIKTPAQAALIILKGREVGLPAIMSLSEVWVMRGKPGLTTLAYGYLMTKAGIKVDFPVHNGVKAVCRLTRPDGRSYEQTFTMDDAARMYTREDDKNIRLSESRQYRANPEEMLMNRAESRAAKRFCPDAIGGAGLMDEIQDVETIDTATAPAAGAPTGLGVTLQERLAGTPSQQVITVEPFKVTGKPEAPAEPPAEPPVRTEPTQRKTLW